MKSAETLLVLIIEDDPDLCDILRIILAKFADVQVANTLKEAKNFLQTRPPTHIFLDNNLPDGLGIDLVPAIRSKDKSVYIVMMTAHNTNELDRRAKEAGADLFIDKPFSLAKIKSIMVDFRQKRTG